MCFMCVYVCAGAVHDQRTWSLSTANVTSYWTHQPYCYYIMFLSYPILNILREFLQTWYKCPVELKDDLVKFWCLKVKGLCFPTSTPLL